MFFLNRLVIDRMLPFSIDSASMMINFDLNRLIFKDIIFVTNAEFISACQAFSAIVTSNKVIFEDIQVRYFPFFLCRFLVAYDWEFGGLFFLKGLITGVLTDRQPRQ